LLKCETNKFVAFGNVGARLQASARGRCKRVAAARRLAMLAQQDIDFGRTRRDCDENERSCVEATNVGRGAHS
jgi:hypothetical protein